MSIKAVKEIPQTLQEKRKSYREMIRQDIQEAIDNHIERFEFEGDYNWKYLDNYAREEADMIWRKSIFYDTSRRVKKELQEVLRPGERYLSMPNAWDYKNKYIKIRTKKSEDRIHVYGEIDFDFAENFYEILKKDTIELDKTLAERRARRKAIRDAETAKHVAEGNTDSN